MLTPLVQYSFAYAHTQRNGENEKEIEKLSNRVDVDYTRYGNVDAWELISLKKSLKCCVDWVKFGPAIQSYAEII